jgi:hypothetical protein
MAPPDEVRVDLLSLEDFRQRLEPRLAEVSSVLSALSVAPAADLPPLGRFEDAERLAARHNAVREAYLDRVQRLFQAVAAAQSATATIIELYRTAEQLNSSTAQDVRHAMRPGLR